MKVLCLVVLVFSCFPHCKSMGANDPRGGAILTPGAWLAGLIKRTTTHSYMQNMKALGLVVSGIFLCFSHDPPGAGLVWIPGARLAGFLKRTTIHCYTKNRKALGLVISEKIFFRVSGIFLCFSHDPPGAGLVWIPGARLAGFLKRTTIHCYTKNRKALGLVISEKIFFMFFPL